MRTGRKYSIALLLTAFVVLGSSFSVYAKIDNAGAGKLKALFERLIEEQKAFVGVDQETRLIFDGKVSVEPSDTYYAVTLPHMSITYPDQSFVEIGMVSINAAPHTVEGQWKMSMAMPTPIILFDNEQKQVIRTDIGAQKAVGIWDEGLDYFSKLDANYKNIRVQGGKSPFELTIPDTSILYDLTPNDQNLWSGPGVFKVQDFSLETLGGTNQVKIREIGANLTFDRYNPAAMQKYKEQLIALTQSLEEGQDGETSAEERTAKIYNIVTAALESLGNGFTSQYDVRDLHITQKNPKPGQPGSINLGKAGFGLDLTGLLENNISMAVRAGFEGLDVQKEDHALKEIAPTGLNMDLSVENLPFKEISALARNTAEGIAKDPKMAQFAGVSLMMKVPALLSQSGTRINIRDNYIAGDLYRVDMNGFIKADMTAVNSATADITSVFTGLDELLAKTKELAADPANAEHGEKLGRLIENMEKIKKMARGEKNAKGQSVYNLHFTMDTQGQMLINGQDAMDLMNPPAEPETP